MPSQIENLDWSDWLNRYLRTFSSPSNKDLVFGKTVLKENPKFTASWLSFVATKTESFDSFLVFEQRFKKLLSTPRKPLIDPPSKKGVKQSDFPQFISKSVEYHHTQKTYREKRKRYEEAQENLDLFKSTYSKSFEGYIQFVQDNIQAGLNDFLSIPQTIPIPNESRWMHTYISGGTGSGKTESIKTIIHHHIINDTESAVVVFDPHGELCFQVAQFREFHNSDRLVYIDPQIFPDHSPAFNPFETSPKIAQDENALDILSQELTEQISMTLGEGSETTEIMNAVLAPCITTLLMRPNSHLGHLLDFMSTGEDKELIKYAEGHLRNKYHLKILKDHFRNMRNDTRQGIVYRLTKLVGKSNFARIICGSSTFDLEQSIKDRKIIIFNLSSKALGKEGSVAFGRLLMAKLFSIATMRDLQNDPDHLHPPIHLFVDECQKYCTKTIEEVLTEARKFGLYATLSNQSSENIDNPDVRKAILTNTDVKIVGREGVAAYRKKSAENIEADPDQIANLAVGNFIIRSGRMPSFVSQNGISLLGNSNAMTPKQWQLVLEIQKRLYYRPIDTPLTPSSQKEILYPEPQSIFDTRTLAEKPTPSSKSSKKRGFNIPKQK